MSSPVPKTNANEESDPLVSFFFDLNLPKEQALLVHDALDSLAGRQRKVAMEADIDDLASLDFIHTLSMTMKSHKIIAGVNEIEWKMSTQERGEKTAPEMATLLITASGKETCIQTAIALVSACQVEYGLEPMGFPVFESRLGENRGARSAFVVLVVPGREPVRKSIESLISGQIATLAPPDQDSYRAAGARERNEKTRNTEMHPSF